MNRLMHAFISNNKPFPWTKAGTVWTPTTQEAYTHGSHPCAINIGDDQFIIAFTRRDANSRSHIFLCSAVVRDGTLNLTSEPKLALVPGAQCYFDCDGVISVCFVKQHSQIYLYYVGWQNLPEQLWICDTGRAVLDPNNFTLRKEFEGPVFGRDKHNPLFAAATAFYATADLWQAWYNSGIKWERTPAGWKHFYGIRYAESKDGIDWVSYPGLCLPFKDEHEYAFGRPSVYVDSGTYYMWFAHRASQTIQTYRIGFASSKDGREWVRNDEIAGIDVSTDGWDSQMICYPYVFEHAGWMYMLYNGNDFGRTGFGLATMELK